MPSILLAWIGDTDLRAPKKREDERGIGPIASAASERSFDRIVLLSDRDPDRTYTLRDNVQVRVDDYLAWLRKRAKAVVEPRHEPLSKPTAYAEIYNAARRAVDDLRGKGVSFTFHVSPGTPAMGSVWIILASTHVKAELIEGSIDGGIVNVEFPFELSADFLPDLLRRRDQAIEKIAAAETPDYAAFEHIIHRSETMKALVVRARRVADTDFGVLIEGESGTGKELLAKAIHRASDRRAHKLIVVNCGAIPENLVESEFFGHGRGAFSGAETERKGHFEEAERGTLFLDEIGELPPPAQVKLLRAIQEKEVVRVGTSKPIGVDVRVIAATNRVLLDDVAQGKFREDLFYRLAIAVLQLPPLRDRAGDISLLLDNELDKINSKPARMKLSAPRRLSAGARNYFLHYPWPGNVRELVNTLHRVVLWSDSPLVSVDDAERSILRPSSRATSDADDAPIEEGFDINATLDSIARRYVERALEQTAGNKSRAASLLGLKSQQVLSGWITRLDVGPPAKRRGKAK